MPGWLLLTVALAVAGVELQHYADLMEMQEQLEQRVQRLERQATRPTLAEQPRAGEIDATLNNTLARYGRAAWTSRFATFEAAADDTVTLLHLVPGKDDISIAGEAKNLAAVTAYAQRLQSSATLAAVRITETETVKDRPMRPMRFSLSSRWRGVAP